MLLDGRQDPSLLPRGTPGVPPPRQGAGPLLRTDPRDTSATRGLMSFEAASARALSFLQQQLPMRSWVVFQHGGDSAPRAAAVTDVAEHDPGAPVERWRADARVAATIRVDGGPVLGSVRGFHPTELEQSALEGAQAVVELVADMLGQILLAQSLREQALVRETELRRLVTRDHLTGLATRAVFHDRLTHALDLHRSTQRSVSVLLMDVDDFKAVNDTHGHATGDAVLVAATSAWSARVSPGNTLARVGGDEFALLVENGLDATALADTIDGLLSQRFDVDGVSVSAPITVSVGLVHLPGDAPTPTATHLLARADAAMYAAKRSGKARLVRYDP